MSGRAGLPPHAERGTRYDVRAAASIAFDHAADGGINQIAAERPEQLSFVHNGRVVKRTGEGSITEFRSVVDAVRCAIEVRTSRRSWWHGALPARAGHCRG
jgi:class 3 adenylate cyclase